MKYPAIKRHYHWPILIAALLSLALSGPLAAQDKERSQKTKQTVAMSQPVYEKLQQTQELVEAGNYGEAQRVLEQLRTGKGKLSEYERAQIWNLSAYSYYLQERYRDAINSYQQVLAQGEIPEALVQSTTKTLAQLYFTLEDYPKALSTIRQLMAMVEDPSPDMYMLLGQAHIQMGNYREAIGPIKTGIEKYRAQNRQPKENWLLLLRVCYYELKDYNNMIGVLKELVTLYPKDTYLLTLAGIYSELGDTKRQMVITEVLYERGYIKNKSYIMNLANLYLLHELPYKAATLLEKEIASERVDANERNLRMLSQAWYQSRNDKKAIPPLERAAAMSSDGELYLRLAQSYLNLENWDAAAKAIQRGLQLGGIKRFDTANVMLGMALLNQKELEPAKSAFRKAQSDPRSKSVASKWLAYVENEISRRSTLEQEIPTSAPREMDEMLQANEPES